MIEKIKVNLSFYVYKTILHDMFSFEFFKKDGDINRNEFLNCIIYNYYQSKVYKREIFKERLLQEAILTDISNKNKMIMIEAASNILDDFYSGDTSEYYHIHYFMIYPTRQTRTFFDELYEKEIKNKMSISSFIRRILNEYAYLPQFIREEIAKRDEYYSLEEAIKEQKIVKFYVSGEEYRFCPNNLIVNKDETHRYLLGLNLNSDKRTPMSIKLCKISNPVILNEKFIYTGKEINQLNSIISSGVEYASGEILEVQISLTDAGRRMIKYRLHNRPEIEETRSNVYVVTCTFSNFINYFIPFGKEVEVLNNDEIRNYMIKFYKDSYESFIKENNE